MKETEIIQKLKQAEKLIGECLANLSNMPMQEKKAVTRNGTAVPKKSSAMDKGKIDFSIPIRPFVKKYAKDMSGPKKFTLIVAHLSNGNLDRKIDLIEIERAWNSMTAILGMKFNRFYSQTAKDNDWVISEKKGTYSLRPSWMEIFN